MLEWVGTKTACLGRDSWTVAFDCDCDYGFDILSSISSPSSSDLDLGYW